MLSSWRRPIVNQSMRHFRALDAPPIRKSSAAPSHGPGRRKSIPINPKIRRALMR
jgi:hypothetical protein